MPDEGGREVEHTSSAQPTSRPTLRERKMCF